MENDGLPSRPHAKGSSSEAGAGLSRADCIAIAVTTALLIALAIWLISPRFSITGPSLVDDWSNLDNAPRALDELLRFSYDPAEVHDSRRYRPGYTAVWNSLQWRTFGAPGDMTGPNFWAVVRLALLVGGLVLLTALSLRTTALRRLGPVPLAAWASAPALLLIVTPPLTRDLARQGPSEPLMLGGMAVGGVLTIFGLRRLLAESATEMAARKIAVALGAIVFGYALWLLGIYQKEVSICVLALLVPLYIVIDRSWRSQGVIDCPLHSHWSFRILAFALVLPLLHMLYEISNVTTGGETVYGAEVPSGLSGWATRLWDSAELQWNSAPVLDVSLWVAVAFAAPWLVLAWVLSHRRVPWIALGLIATAVSVYLFQGLANVVVTRYFIPVAALLAVASVLLLVDGPRLLRVAALAGVAVFAAQAVDARDLVRDWADYQETRVDAVREIAKLDPGRCPVYTAFLHAEDADAIPELVDVESRRAGRRCDPRYEAYMIRGHEAGEPATNEAIYETCAGVGWVELGGTEPFSFFGCRRLLAGGDVQGQEVDDILRWDRLVPGERLSERIHSLPDDALCESPQCMPQLSELRETYR
jgi:hypothetical protein